MGKVSSRKEIKDSVLNTTRQSDSQIGDLVEDFINITLNEISDPGWAFGSINFTHNWSFLRRKDTFSTVASTEDYVLPRDVDRISFIRQTDSPSKIAQVSDEEFYSIIPNPEAEGNPLYYRIWENEGVSTRLTTADTIDVVSSSASDAGSATKTVTVWGTDANGAKVSETYQLNGTSTKSGSITFAAGPIFVSKQSDTVGDITLKENSGSTTLVVIGREERTPKFKVVSFYPIPSDAITIYLEYYTRIRQLRNDSDTPEFDEKWHWVVRQGALAKVFQFLNKDPDYAMAQAMFASAVKSMVSADRSRPDLIRHLSINRIFPLFTLNRATTITS